MSVYMATESKLQQIKELLGNISDEDITSQGMLNKILSELEDGVYIIPNLPISIQIGAVSSSVVSVTGKGRAIFFAPHAGRENHWHLGNVTVDGVQIGTNTFLGIYGSCEIDFKHSISFVQGTISATFISSSKYAILLY